MRPHNAPIRLIPGLVCLGLLALLAGCTRGGGSGGTLLVGVGVESCMSCHNGAGHDDYAGAGIENPHPFGGAATLSCTSCHGGNPRAGSAAAAHVPPPPEVGSELNQTMDAVAYFNRLTMAGLDKFPDYMVGGVTHTSLSYLQFVNPGDLRVVTAGLGCGKCHMPHAQASARSMLATEAGIFSSSGYTLGTDNEVVGSSSIYENTAVDFGFRAQTDPNFVLDPTVVGLVGSIKEFPVRSVFGANTSADIFNNPAFFAANLPNSQRADNTVIPNSPLATLFREQVAFTCGDCHLGHAGANNRYGDFRSSGCTACHMRYSHDGRSQSSDNNIRKGEPLNPDAIRAPERPHVARHVIKSVARMLATGEFMGGIDDHTCAGCHQGSNRTVLQYWGIRLDQNADVPRRNQYPADPVTFRTTAQDTRLYDPAVGNRTFNGRNSNQYILFEDYDGDGRDDTPEDIHYEAGLGCIDCHGSHDVHGGQVSPEIVPIRSRMAQAVSIRCENCHGSIDAYASTAPCTSYDGVDSDCAVDEEGIALKHVTRGTDGELYLVSRLDGRRHHIPQTKDVVVNAGKRHPGTTEAIYSPKASYAMGRADGTGTQGIGPLQSGFTVTSGFSHTDSMSCVACHASWTNNCIGCHLKGEYNTGGNASNVTGQRIVYKQANADFVYQTPVPFQLGVDSQNRINPIMPNTEAFFQWLDKNRQWSQIFSFTDRNGNGHNPSTGGRSPYPALSHNVMMPHSIRGKVTGTNEGVRYCVSCHLTTEALTNYGTQYDAYRQAMVNKDFTALDFDLLKDHIGKNPGNQIDSPFWVHMVSGLGSGLFLFDAQGCPINPLDDNPNRIGCDGVAPKDKFDLTRVALNLDSIVEATGVSNSSSSQPMRPPNQTPNRRDGSLNSNLAGPLGSTLIRKLTDPATGIVLDSWIDADGQLQGGASGFIPP